MKKIDNTLKKNSLDALREHHLSSLVVRPLARRIKRQGRTSIEQGKRIFRKLREIEASIEIVAREIARQAKRGE